jgi:hypothetical protein
VQVNKSKSIGTTVVGLLIAAAAATFAPGVHGARAQDEHATPVCNNAILRGTYGFQRNGTTSQGPLTATGIGQFDGMGTAVAQQTISRSGKFTVVTDQVGLYTINPDCTGTVTDQNGNVFASLVVVHNGAEVLGMSMTAGNNVAIHYERIVDPPGNALHQKE